MYTDEYNATLQLSGKMETPCGESFYYIYKGFLQKVALRIRAIPVGNKMNGHIMFFKFTNKNE